MKTTIRLLDSILVICLAAVMTFFLTLPAHSQDTVKKSSRTVIKVKVIKDENGVKTIIDTSFSSDRPVNPRQMRRMMADLDHGLRGQRPGRGVYRFNFSDTDFPDSSMMDSIEKDTDRIMMFSKKLRDHHLRGYKLPHEYDLDFDMDIPEPPFPPEPPEPGCDPRGYYNFDPFQGCPPGCGRSGEGSLLDILGDIPLDRIKNFSMKEKKDGTKITIEVERGPVFGFPHSKKNVIIVRPDHGNQYRHAPDKKVEKKVIIKTDKEDPEKL
jgi:hypothetical protein